MAHYRDLIDTDTPGPRYDVTPIFKDHEAFSSLVRDLSSHFDPLQYEVIVAIDALGFILGAALAIQLGKGLVPVRKGGKLPTAVDSVEFADYSRKRKALEMRIGALEAGERVLIVDEWIETGAQVKAAIRLVEKQGGIVVGIAAINIDENESTRPLLDLYDCHAVWHE